MEQLRKCNRCGERRAIADYYKRRDGSVNPWCKSCYRDWYADRNGGRTTRKCDQCDTSMEVTARRAAELKVFCSRACKDVFRKAEQSAALHAAKPPRVCVWCGDPLDQRMRKDAKFCSADCNSRAHRTTRKFRRRLGKDAPLRPRTEPLINFAEIAERDHWRCGLCGGAVSKNREYPDPLAASIDHVIPLSQGGDNESVNLQLTHLRCNLSKRDRPWGEQLRLIG